MQGDKHVDGCGTGLDPDKCLQHCCSYSNRTSSLLQLAYAAMLNEQYIICNLQLQRANEMVSM